MHGLKELGDSNIVQSVSMGLLALKHRRNKNGGQRIVVFVASPLEVEEKSLVKVGKVCKKNNVGIDVVVMGEVRSGPASDERRDIQRMHSVQYFHQSFIPTHSLSTLSPPPA
jgi:hypothetical protein